MPTVSIVMSAYNEEKVISRAIKSVLTQTYGDFELIIVDDASVDSTARIIADFCERDPRIVFIKNELNLGLTRSLIKGVERARGQFITRIDADDYYGPRKIEIQVSTMLRQPECRWSATMAGEVDSTGKLLHLQGYDFRSKSSEELLDYMYKTNNALYHGAVMFTKELYLMAGGYNPIFNGAEDYELWLRFSSLSPVALIRDVLYFRESRVTGISMHGAIRQSIIATGVRRMHNARQLGQDGSAELTAMQNWLSSYKALQLKKYVGEKNAWDLASKLFCLTAKGSLPLLVSLLTSRYALKSLLKIILLILPSRWRRALAGTKRKKLDSIKGMR
ncbi:glycosyl transferase family 2 [Alicyclobacillus hesperidum URH17-3-68]|uniref:glycosyltransferase family 2 protein n=1 Tax=Alicyclobacillus hesperidum TaxID=89784 RepID=UPI000281C4BD|nr:glycosyltransferase family 2 protein [Alicyclobacillus hesperidum]EJY54504.1 glycosyl transferase family 2 [Alicyclobacillus hesperidum URH17-3-68]